MGLRDGCVTVRGAEGKEEAESTQLTAMSHQGTRISSLTKAHRHQRDGVGVGRGGTRRRSANTPPQHSADSLFQTWQLVLFFWGAAHTPSLVNCRQGLAQCDSPSSPYLSSPLLAFSIIVRHIPGNGVEIHDGIRGDGLDRRFTGNSLVFHQGYGSQFSALWTQHCLGAPPIHRLFLGAPHAHCPTKSQPLFHPTTWTEIQMSSAYGIRKTKKG